MCIVNNKVFLYLETKLLGFISDSYVICFDKITFPFGCANV